MNELTLPNGVTFNGVLYNKAHLEELTGKQQNYLVNTKYKSPVDHIEFLLVDLLIDLRDANNNSILKEVDKRHLLLNIMAIQDVQFLLIKLREISFGEKYFFDKLECPHCKAKNSAQIELDKLDIIREAKAETKELTLPKSGLSIEYKPLHLSELKAYGADSERVLNNHVTEACISMLAKLGDKKPEAKDIESLKAKDTQYIVDNAPKYDYLDNKITHSCTSCTKDFDFELGEISPDFFVHSRI
jgi:hypothetical protein